MAWLVAFGFTLFARRLSSSILTAPMLFIGIGFLLSNTGLVDGEAAEHSLRLVAEITLIILFIASLLAPTDAAFGQSVVSNKLVPERVRRELTVEKYPVSDSQVDFVRNLYSAVAKSEKRIWFRHVRRATAQA